MFRAQRQPIMLMRGGSVCRINEKGYSLSELALLVAALLGRPSGKTVVISGIDFVILSELSVMA